MMRHPLPQAAALALMLGAAAFALSRLGGHSLVASSAPAPTPVSRAAPAPASPYVTAAGLSPRLRAPFRALGDRLSRPGKERRLTEGELEAEGSPARRVLVVYESPGSLRVTGPGGADLLTPFEERGAARARSAAEEVLIETLFYDSAEHFFFAQAAGAATRLLGLQAIAEGEGGAPPGPACDVYEVTEEVSAGGARRPVTKRYFFNSDTQLLEVVRYEEERGGETIPVEVRLGGWRRVNGQQVAASVVRFEGGRQVLSFTARASSFAPAGAGNAAPPASASGPA